MSSATTDSVSGLSRRQAETIVESLRTGIPPAGHLREFTVGRRKQLARLTDHFLDPSAVPESLLIQANYGAGKTHLLRLVREVALEAGYAVALVTVDSRSRVRFNRMDQVTAATMRALEVPGSVERGIGALFNRFLETDVDGLSLRNQAEYSQVTDGGKWGMSSVLRCAPLWIALRAWHLSRAGDAHDVIDDWLTSSWDYKSKRALLYDRTIRRLPPTVREPRTEAQLYRDKAFLFDPNGHQAAWDALPDLDLLARLSGLKGLVLLFDEFEDVIQNMNNIGYERAAFTNLLLLFQRRMFPGFAYFAVTPQFAQVVRDRLLAKLQWDYPVERFDELERVKMTPVTADDFRPLAGRVRDVHGLAYGWNASVALSDRKLDTIVKRLFERPQADQVRQAITGLVAALDRELDA
jgi:hypothetical protein